MSKYAIWDRISNVKVPSGHVYNAQEWAEKYPAYDENSVMVLSGGFFNGSMIAEISQLKELCENKGAVFSPGLSNQELLDQIEQFEVQYANEQVELEKIPTTEERIAAALEFQNLMLM